MDKARGRDRRRAGGGRLHWPPRGQRCRDGGHEVGGDETDRNGMSLDDFRETSAVQRPKVSHAGHRRVPRTDLLLIFRSSIG